MKTEIEYVKKFLICNEYIKILVKFCYIPF